MRLSQKLEQSGRNAVDQQTNERVGTIQGAVLSYQRNITALFEGKPVTLLGGANIVGMSQCEKFVPLTGDTTRPDWAPSAEIEVIAIDGVPVGHQGTQQYAEQGSSTRHRT